MTHIWPISWKGGALQPTVVPVNSERMLILRVALPPLPKGQRRSAAAFAVEPFIGQPLEDAQVVLGPRLEADAASSYLVVVMTHDVHAQILAEHRLSKARLVPDVLLLPRPSLDHWVVANRDGRLLARLPDGTGFAAPEPAFLAIWAQSGRPAVDWHHGTPPAGLPLASQDRSPMPLIPEPALARFDLAEGRVPDWRQPRKLAALAAVLVLGLCAHLTLLAVDTHGLAVVADASEARLRTSLTARGIAVGTSVDAAVATAVRGAQGGKGPAFLALLSQTMQAMAAQTGLVTLQDLSFDHRAARLTMTLAAPDLGPLQEAAAMLTKAGLAADLGASTTSKGQARATIAVKAGVAG